MPVKSYTIAPLRYPRPEPPRRRARLWPWLIVLALLAAAIYVTVRPRPEPVPPPPPAHPRIGVIAGHWQYDSGAICDDGLREVDITTAVARLVVEGLRARGYDAEMLAEYDDRMAGYRASAVVSLHADSCAYDLSGFKCVGPASSDSRQLVQALSQAYESASGLNFHADTITPAMTGYHAFKRIDRSTPAAIIEMGFMSGDRDFLVAQPEQAAQGIIDGLVAFLEAQAGPASTPSS